MLPQMTSALNGSMPIIRGVESPDCPGHCLSWPQRFPAALVVGDYHRNDLPVGNPHLGEGKNVYVQRL